MEHSISDITSKRRARSPHKSVPELAAEVLRPLVVLYVDVSFSTHANPIPILQ